jgi:hypothetical protein
MRCYRYSSIFDNFVRSYSQINCSNAREPAHSHDLVQRDSCRFAFQGGTQPLNDFNGFAGTELPSTALQLRLPREYLAVKMGLIDWSIDRSFGE